MIRLRDIVFLLFLWSVAASCVSHSDLLYFRRGEPVRQIDSTILSVGNFLPLQIQKSDVLAITVRSFEQDLAMPFNLSIGEATTPRNTFLVDEEGFIDFPVLGKIHLEGKTVNEAKDTIDQLLRTYLEAPSIHMRLLNFQISVLGEVGRPGNFSIDSDRITLLEALALASDLTPYANAKNILVIREQNGRRTLGEVNLQSTSFLNSEFYYLRQGDVIYVEPRRDKQAIIRDNVTEYTSFIGTGISIAVGIATLILISSR